MFEEVADQLEAYCDCLPEKLEREKLLKLIEEMIWLVSNWTCWANRPCETLLNSKRQEVFEVEAFQPCSCEGVFTLPLYYYFPLDPKSFEVFLITTEGVVETSEKLNAQQFNYSEVTGELKVDLRPYIGGVDCCACPDEYKLLVTYNAGYERLPDCLLQLFCELLQLLYHKSNCDCEACQSCKDKNPVGVVLEDGEALEAMQDTTVRVEKYLMGLIASSYKRQLGLLSLCGRKRIAVWGKVT